MPTELQDLFWSFHGETMARLGYGQSGGITPLHPDLDLDLSLKLGFPPASHRRNDNAGTIQNCGFEVQLCETRDGSGGVMRKTSAPDSLLTQVRSTELALPCQRHA